MPLRKATLFVLVALGASGQSPRSASSAHPKSRIAQAKALYDRGNTREACTIFNSIAAQRPSDPEPRLYLLGCALRKQDEAAAASERAALDPLLAPGSSMHAVAAGWLAAAGRCDDAAAEYRLSPPPLEPGAVESALGQCRQNTGDAAGALGLFRDALRLNPGKEENHLLLAFLLIGTGQTDEAGRALVDAARQFPSSARIITTMSLLHLELGYPDRARLGYEQARRLAPDSAMVWKLLGRIQHAEGAYDDAVKSFDAAAARDGKDPQTFLFRGLAEVRTEGATDRALADFERAAQLDPALLEARFQAASLYLQAKGDARRASRELETIVAAAPDFARAHQLLVQAYQRMGLRDKAAAEARKVRELEQPAGNPHD